MKTIKMLSGHLLIRKDESSVHINPDEVRELFVYLLHNYSDELLTDMREFLKRL